MSESAALLVEIGCEEIPARLVAGLAEGLAGKLGAGMEAAGLIAAAAEVTAAWTPRRLIARHAAVRLMQAGREEEIVGPPARVAFDAAGEPTPQALGFAQKQGLAPEALYRLSTPKGEYVAARRTIAGQAAGALLPGLLAAAFAGLELPRAMRWKGKARFIRPVRWVVALLGDAPLAVEIAGVRAGPVSQGHRTLSAGAFAVAAAADFPERWRDNFVLPEAAERRTRIERGLAAAAGAGGARMRPDAGLLETLVNLTEYPGVISGGFDAALLGRLPEEVLVTAMRDHQKYFALEDAAGRLAPGFAAVMNLDGDREGLVRHGNERVLRARFNDAAFFWDADRQRRLEDRLPLLAHVTFHASLGSYLEKSGRIEKLAGWLAETWRIDAAAAARAARLAKCDLTCELVKEFTELQGIMGGRYAEAEGEPEPVWQAIYDQYLPLAAQGSAPRHGVAAAVSVADKLDSIAGLFSAGEAPTGSADPLALRRQANGVIRTLLVRGLNLDLREALERALAPFGDGDAAAHDTLPALLRFFAERLAFYLREVEGVAYDAVAAVLAAGAEPLDALERARLLEAARRDNPLEFAQVAAAIKRMRNIVKKEGGLEQWSGRGVDPKRFEPAEAALALAVEHAAAGDYSDQLRAMASLQRPLERFFDEVRVNADDAGLRANRLALLAWAVERVSRLADFAELVVAA